ncbi:MAG: metallophosphoesterase [archaeon]|nr:metallophosphoesterase [archaeon]
MSSHEFKGMDSIEIMPGVRVTKDKCLVLDEGPTIVLSDLHLGYEKALEEEGVYLPRINTESVVESLNKVVYKYDPKRVVILGDIKHDFRRASYEAREEVCRTINLLKDVADVIIIKGNHDNFIQSVLQDLNVEAVDYIDMYGFRMEHGHLDSGKRPVIIGHEHPSVRISGAVGGGIKLQCFLHLKREGIIVIPPFSNLSSGSSLGNPETFISPACKASYTDDADVYGVSDFGVLYLGKLGEVSKMEL